MATLAADKTRTYEVGDPNYNHLPVVASDIIYAGAAVGDNASGFARPLVAGDPFLGFAVEKADNSGGSAGDKDVKVRSKGRIEVNVVGVVDEDDVGVTVYASDDDTFTLTVGSNTAIGKVRRHVSGTLCVVDFEAVTDRSL